MLVKIYEDDLHSEIHSITSTEAVLPSKPFSKSTHLALENFCPDVLFCFLNTGLHVPIVYTYLCSRFASFGTNTKNLSDCSASFPLIILNACIISCSPVLLVQFFQPRLFL